MIVKALVLTAVLLTAHAAKAERSFVLITTNFCITVIDRTPEYELGCTNVTYIGVSRKTGKAIVLTGSTNFSMGKDGSPGHFRGYDFRSGLYLYTLNNEGGWVLDVMDRKGRTVVNERAIAQYD